MIAEPAKVGVWVKTPESGKITVNKTFKSENTERTFYFAVFTRNENNKFVLLFTSQEFDFDRYYNWNN